MRMARKAAAGGDLGSLTYKLSAFQYGSAPSETGTLSATHDISRVNYHVKHLDSFVQTLQEVCWKYFPTLYVQYRCATIIPRHAN